MKKRYILYGLAIILLISTIICGVIIENNRYHGEIKLLEDDQYTEGINSYIDRMRWLLTPFFIINYSFVIFMAVDIVRFGLLSFREKKLNEIILISLLKLGVIISLTFSFSMANEGEFYLNSTGKIIISFYSLILPIITAFILLMASYILTKYFKNRKDEESERNLNSENHKKWDDFMNKSK